jgi:hypothetical protein
MGAALRYISNQWQQLTVFMSDPKIPIQNNASESALRIVALSRKNTLFFSHEQAARNFSILYSLDPTAGNPADSSGCSSGTAQASGHLRCRIGDRLAA